MPQSHTTANPRYHDEETKTITVTWHQDDKNSKTDNSLFLSKMIAKLERTQSTA